MTTTRGHNVACHVEDFSSDDVRTLIRELFPEEARSESFPRGVENRAHWEGAMALRALQAFGALRPGSRLLVVGAGVQPVVFHLARHAGEVVAVDNYLDGNGCGSRESFLMLASPQSTSRVAFDPARLTLRHMSAQVLGFAGESFDGVLASAAILRSLDDEGIAAAAFEMGRVLRPGGVLTLTLDLLVMGPAGAEGFPGGRLFTEADLRHLVVEASGLELVDGLDVTVSPATLETPRDMEAILEDRETERGSGLPHLVAVHQGQVFTSVHLALRKGATWPVNDNAWAEPADSLRARVRHEAEDAVARLLRSPDDVAAAPPVDRLPGGGREALRDAFDAWDAVRARTALTAPSSGPTWRRLLGFIRRSAGRLRDLGVLWDRERDVLRALVARQDELERRLDDLMGRRDR